MYKRAASVILLASLSTAAHAKVKGKLPYPCGPNAKFTVERAHSDDDSIRFVAPADSGLLVVVSDGDGATNQGVAVDGRWVGAIHRNGGYFAYKLRPGKHELCSTGFVWGSWNNPGFLTLDVEPGRVYYVVHRADFGDSAFARSTFLKIIDPLQGLQDARRQKKTTNWQAIPVAVSESRPE